MSKFYSASTRGFYTPEIHGNSMPSDVIEISDADWQQLLDQQSLGKQIAVVSGVVTAIDQQSGPSET